MLVKKVNSFILITGFALLFNILELKGFIYSSDKPLNMTLQCNELRLSMGGTSMTANIFTRFSIPPTGKPGGIVINGDFALPCIFTNSCKEITSYCLNGWNMNFDGMNLPVIGSIVQDAYVPMVAFNRGQVAIGGSKSGRISG